MMVKALIVHHICALEMLYFMQYFFAFSLRPYFGEIGFMITNSFEYIYPSGNFLYRILIDH